MKFNPDEQVEGVALVRAVMPSDPTHPLSLESLRRQAGVEWAIHVDEDNSDAVLAQLPKEQEWAFRLGEVYSEETIIEKLGLGRLQAEAVFRLNEEVADLFQERYEALVDRRTENQVDDFYVSETDPTGEFSVRHEPS